jgi:predicted Fe-Mo cluster-binding NifX family protein
MKVCVTAQGEGMEAAVDPRFGRARFFLVYDDEAEGIEAIDNSQNLNAAGGAGVQSATTVSETGCEWVISGHIGPKAMAVLQAAGIKVCVGAEGTVGEAIEALARGELQQVSEADVAQHW